MSRPLRLEFPEALYHLTSREDRREDIYEDDEDRLAFLDVFSSVIEQFNWVCYAYCLMSNHYHLLVKTPDANLSNGVRLFNGVNIQAYIRRHQKTGHLFQGRYKSILADEAFLQKVQRHMGDQEKDLQIPKIQRRSVVKTLAEYERMTPERDEAIVRMYASGAYSYQELALL
jgi:REP element-mobilizing transposase RayT